MPRARIPSEEKPIFPETSSEEVSRNSQAFSENSPSITGKRDIKKPKVMMMLLQGHDVDTIVKEVNVTPKYVRMVEQEMAAVGVLGGEKASSTSSQRPEPAQPIYPIVQGYPPHEITREMCEIIERYGLTGKALPLAEEVIFLRRALAELRARGFMGGGLSLNFDGYSTSAAIAEMRAMMQEWNRMRMQRQLFKDMRELEQLESEGRSKVLEQILERLERLEKKSEIEKFEEKFSKQLEEIRERLKGRGDDSEITKRLNKLEELFHSVIEDKKIEELRRELKELKSEKGTPFDKLLEIQKSISERELKHREELEKKDRELLIAMFNQKLEKLSDQLASLQAGKKIDTKEIIETFTAIKEISREMGIGQGSGADKAEMVRMIGEIIKEPLKPIGEAMAERLKQPSQPQIRYVPVPVQQLPQQTMPQQVQAMPQVAKMPEMPMPEIARAPVTEMPSETTPKPEIAEASEEVLK